MQFPGQPPGRKDEHTLWLKVDIPEKDYTNPTIFAKFVRQHFILYSNGEFKSGVEIDVEG